MFRNIVCRTPKIWFIVAFLVIVTSVVAFAQTSQFSVTASLTGGGKTHKSESFQVTTVVSQAVGSRHTQNGFAVQTGIGGVIAEAQSASSDTTTHVFLPAILR